MSSVLNKSQFCEEILGVKENIAKYQTAIGLPSVRQSREIARHGGH
jgi:hypothetical protein